MLLGVIAIFWNAIAGGVSRSDIASPGKIPVGFIFLWLAWWIAMSTTLARGNEDTDAVAENPTPAVPPLFLALRNVKGTFLIAPICAFVLTQMSAALTWPTIRLNLLGAEIVQLAHVEKLGSVAQFPNPGQRCFTTARLTLTADIQLDRCLSDRLYRSLKPGDGVGMPFLVHDDLIRLRALRRVPAPEMPATLMLNRDLITHILRRAAKDQSGTSAQ
ncbi:hypothetical protein [Pseudogemmobacter bohemicus]|uniref:hypothetical protein n=1 Tax=Pseudogemmobacter bohemicus TaxID=2250708 RepID=UPI001E53C9BF|nr:hypothetical protein [Pseudogemmobacter bohemicus]